MPTEDVMKADLDELGRMLSKRAREHKRLRSYVRGAANPPEAVENASLTRAYRLLMPLADAPWAATIIEAVRDRLEATGIDSGNETLDSLLREDWRRNEMDSEATLAHSAALTSGRAYATVWPDKGGKPRIVLDSPENMIVRFAEGSRSMRQVAMRRWVDGDRVFANLYYPDGIYKFEGPEEEVVVAGEVDWKRREVPDEVWPLTNRLKTVPVAEIATNRELEAGAWPFARGEFEHCTGLIDRVQLLTFLGLIVAFWMGFPLRVLIGEKILRDDENNPIPPFDVNADSLAQLESPDAKLDQFEAADRKNLSVFDELEQLATVSNTPRHYFPMAAGGSNISAETVVAWESGLHGKIATRHKPQFGIGWETVWALCAKIHGTELPATARTKWADHESRSLAERADAAVKLKDILPWQALAEKVLNANAEQIAQWEAQRGSDAFSQLLRGAQQPPTQPEPEPVAA